MLQLESHQLALVGEADGGVSEGKHADRCAYSNASGATVRFLLTVVYLQGWPST
jgi:hypothetical protein